MRVFFAAVFALSLLAGCGSDGSLPGFGGGGTHLPVSYEAVHTGTDGVRLEFLNNAPPSSLFGSQQFKIGLKVHNRGAYEVRDGVVAITVEPDYMRMDSVREKFSLRGREVFNLAGENTILIFGGESRVGDSQIDERTAVVLATACYRYSTALVAETCVDTDVLNIQNKGKACSVSESSSFQGGQGSPVAVQSFDAKMIPEGSGSRFSAVRPHYTLHIRNLGDGSVISSGVDPEAVCSSRSLKEGRPWNVVAVGAKLGDRELDCSPKQLILTGKDDIVRCSGEAVSSDLPSYVSVLSVSLDYGYSSTVSKDVKVSRI